MTKENKLQEMQELFNEVQNDNKQLKKFLKELSQMEKRSLKLSEYYTGEWIEEREMVDSALNYFEITNEDSIYDELTDQYILMKKLLKKCADYINK